MGVQGIWEHIQPYALVTDIQNFKKKKLAIDGHIWFFESMRGSAAHGTATTHIVTFFNRISRLKELGIEPIVVFDNYTDQYKAHNFVHVKKSKRGAAQLAECADYKQKIDDICELLTAMGVRSVMAIGQGEAQCAQLEMVGLVDGCITSDFDYLLYGGKNLYKVEFAQGGRMVRAQIRHFSIDHIYRVLHLNRERLVALAMLLGCDYFEGGIERIGVVRGLEIIAEFAMNEDDHPATILDRFYAYAAEEVPERDADSKTRRKLRKASYSFPDGFPNADRFLDSMNAYLMPDVYNYKELPEKGPLVLDDVEQLMFKHCNWGPEKVGEMLNRSEKRAQKNVKAASKLTSFFSPMRRRSSGRSAVVSECSKEDSASCSRREWAALTQLRSKAHFFPVCVQLLQSSVLLQNESQPGVEGSASKKRGAEATSKESSARKRRPPSRPFTNSVIEIDDTSSSVIFLE